MSATPLSGVSVTDLSREYPGATRPALNGVTLDVAAGTALALLGPSGSGKSTALRLISGLDEPTRGSVRIAGRDITATPAESRGVGMVFQRPLLFPHLSVLDNVAFAGRAAGLSRRDSRREASRYLELVAVADLADRSSAAISGGQAQRVAIARALAAQPSVLLLDEPFSALDSVLRAEMYRLLRDIRAEVDPTIVMVTHDQAEAVAVAERIAVLIDGTLEHESDVATAYRRPSTVAVHRLMGGLTEVSGTVGQGAHHSDLGALPVPDDCPVSSGPGVLVLRHESVVVGSANDAQISGTVVAIEAAGVRRRVTVAVGAARVVVDLAPDTDVQEGATLGLVVPRAATWVVEP